MSSGCRVESFEEGFVGVAAAGLALFGAPQTESADRRWHGELDALHAAVPDDAAFRRAWEAGRDAGVEAAARRALAVRAGADTAA